MFYVLIICFCLMTSITCSNLFPMPIFWIPTTAGEEEKIKSYSKLGHKADAIKAINVDAWYTYNQGCQNRDPM